VLVLINGAYGLRLAKLTQMMGRKVTTFETAEDVPTPPRTSTVC
jgi:2-aminoethylphosphonate-pyruvate transaminase